MAEKEYTITESKVKEIFKKWFEKVNTNGCSNVEFLSSEHEKECSEYFMELLEGLDNGQ